MGCEFCKQSGVSVDSAEQKIEDDGDALNQIVEFLSKVDLFKRLPKEEHPVLAKACETKSYPKGQVLITQGGRGNSFYVIKSGQVVVLVDDVNKANLTRGDHFGELALLRDEPRRATVKAESNVVALKITRDQFRNMGLHEKLEFTNRKAVGGGIERPLVVKPPSKKTPDDRKVILEGLRANVNLKILNLDDAKFNSLVDVAWEEEVEAGRAIITQGSEDADYFYVVKEGSFEIYKDEGPSSLEKVEHQNCGVLSRGGSFGELALLYYCPRAATVKARVKSTVWVIDRNNFRSMFERANDVVAETYVKYIEETEVFKSLKKDEKFEIAKALLEAGFEKGETIFEQGEVGTHLFLLIEGTVAVIIDGKEVAQKTGSSGKVAIFGEQAVVSGQTRTATIKVVSDAAKTLTIDKKSCELLLGPLAELARRSQSGESKVGKGDAAKVNAQVAERARTRAKIYRKDLNRLGLLGCGGFGAVELVEHNVTKETYALKALSKGYVVKCGMKKGVISEKNIQIMCDSPFVVNLYETYNGEQSLYFLLELALGGELYATYNKKGFHGSEKHAKFYVAGTVYAFEHLHEKKIIYRDLKPENLLLTETGHIKLTDMGLAKVVAGKTYTTCGTPDYFAPEVIASTGHTHAVDWWCLGILTFELMSGHPPFEAAAPMQIYQKVQKGIAKVTIPAAVKGSCEDLVKGLLKKEPSDRLPMKKGGVENIQKAVWFNGFDWNGFKSLKMDTPYKPKVKNKKDRANFSARKEDMPPQVKYTDDGTGWDKDFATSS